MTEGAHHVLDQRLQPVLPDVLAELYLSEDGLAASYFSRPEIAADRLVADPFGKPGERMFRTGELVRVTGAALARQPGRPTSAQQSAEMAQIEFTLSTVPPPARLNVSLIDPDQPEVGYLVSIGCPGAEVAAIDLSALRERAELLLPQRLVPAAIVVCADQLLTAPELPTMVAETIAGQDDSPPGRARLRALFAEVLHGCDVDDQLSFLDAGGQSMTATVLISKINAAFEVELSIADLFNAPSVAELADRLPELPAAAPELPISPFESTDSFLVLAEPAGSYSLWPAELAVPDGWTPVHGPSPRASCLDYVNQHWTSFRSIAERARQVADTGLPPASFPLSYNQEFFCTLDEGDQDSPFGDRHTLVAGWRIRGSVQPAVLQRAINDLVERHEILRTTIRRGVTPRYQRVHDSCPAPLEIRSMPISAELTREFQCEQLLSEIEDAPLGVHQLPLLQAVLGRFDHDDSVLVLSAHHIAVDAWSMQLLIRDLAFCYAQRCGYQLSLPAVHPYREYAVAQRDGTDPRSLQAQIGFWRRELAGAQLVELPPTQRQAMDGLSSYAMHSFAIDGELATDAAEFASELRASTFMVLLSAFYLLACRLTGQTDLVVPTSTTGRTEECFHDTVGPFTNVLPVRTDIAGCASFRELVERTRINCIQAYSHDVPFECIEAAVPGLLGSVSDGVESNAGSPATFEMVQSPLSALEEAVGDLQLTELRRRLLVEGPCPDVVPNGMRWVLNLVTPDDIVGTIRFKRTEFGPEQVAELVADYRQLLRRLLDAPDGELAAIR